MYKNLRWKLITIAAVTLVATFLFMPPKQKVKLGLDLQGGVHLVLKVQTNDALRSIRALSDLLARHPEALIKGRPAGPLE